MFQADVADGESYGGRVVKWNVINACNIFVLTLDLSEILETDLTEIYIFLSQKSNFIIFLIFVHIIIKFRRETRIMLELNVT